MFDVVVEPGSLKYDVNDFITSDFSKEDYGKFIETFYDEVESNYLEDCPKDNYLVCKLIYPNLKKQGFGEVEGIVAYRICDNSLVVDNFQIFNVYKNAMVRKSLFTGLTNVCADKEISKVVLSTVENPDFYRKECDAKVVDMPVFAIDSRAQYMKSSRYDYVELLTGFMNDFDGFLMEYKRKNYVLEMDAIVFVDVLHTLFALDYKTRDDEREYSFFYDGNSGINYKPEELGHLNLTLKTKVRFLRILLCLYWFRAVITKGVLFVVVIQS